jgi:foldase protein PrsA
MIYPPKGIVKEILNQSWHDSLAALRSRRFVDSKTCPYYTRDMVLLGCPSFSLVGHLTAIQSAGSLTAQNRSSFGDLIGEEPAFVKRIIMALIVVSCVNMLLVACSQPADTPTSAVVSSPSAPAAKLTSSPATTNPPTAAQATKAVAGGASPQAQPTSRAVKTVNVTPVASVNGTPISRADYNRELAQAQAEFLKQPSLDAKSEAGQQGLQGLQTQVLGWMIDQVLIEQSAMARGIKVTDAQVDAEIKRMRGDDQARFDAWLAENGLTPESLRQQVRIDLLTAAVRDAVTTSVSRKVLQVHVRHILTSNESVAQTALAQIKQGQKFDAVAKKYSEDESTRNKGGDLGFLPQGAMPPSFDQVAFSLKAGQVSDIVRSEFGFHIIQVIEIDPQHQVSDELWPVVQQHAFETWLADQRAKANIQRSN